MIHSWNRGAERLFGYKAADVIGKPVTLLIPPDREDEEPRILRLIARGEKLDHFKTVRCRRNGSLVDISLSVTPIRDASGRVIGATKVARDITETQRRQQQQNTLVQDQQRLAAIIEFSDDAMVSCDLRGTVQTWSKGAERLFRYREEDILGRTLDLLILESRQEEARRMLEHVGNGEPIERRTMTCRRKDGTSIDTLISLSPLRDLSGAVVGVWFIGRAAAKTGTSPS